MTEQLQLIQVNPIRVNAYETSHLGAICTVPGDKGMSWHFAIQRDGDGWYVTITHWMPGPATWSQEVICRTLFTGTGYRRARPVPHDLVSMAAFARWMLTGEGS